MKDYIQAVSAQSSACYILVRLGTEINHPLPIGAGFILLMEHSNTFPVTFKHVTVGQLTRG